MRPHRPSPAMVVALIALFVALGGTGYAAATGSIDGREIKNNTIQGKDVKDSALTGGDVKNNSLTGSDVVESGLGKVPSATNADTAGRAGTAGTANSATTAGSAATAATAGSATTAGSANSVNGSTLQKINYQVEGIDGPTVIFNRGGLVIRATCGNPTGLSALTAETTVDGTDIRYYTVSETGTVTNAGEAEPLNTGTTQNLRANNNNDQFGHLVYTRPDGTVVSIDWAINGSSGGTIRPGTNDNFDCQVTGNAIVG